MRFNDGGSGSFVSAARPGADQPSRRARPAAEGLDAAEELRADGFYAKTAAEELKCPDLEAERADVDGKRHGACAGRGASGARRPHRRSKRARKSSPRSSRKARQRPACAPTWCRLYQGSEYRLYRYKKYTDVRLVFAPEQQIAFFGGDPDNFTFPRYDFDMALFRVYENNAPVASRDYLKWSAKGAADGELVFVSGHPGSTDRLDTVAQLETERDLVYPISIAVINRRLAVLRQYSEQGAEQARQAANTLFSLENALKAYKGEFQGLNDVNALGEEADRGAAVPRARLMRIVSGRPRMAAPGRPLRPPSGSIAASTRRIDFNSCADSSLAGLASTLVRYIEEKPKPDSERLAGYHDSQLPALELQLFSPAPVYPALDEVLLADALQESLEQLGPSDPFIRPC